MSPVFATNGGLSGVKRTTTTGSAPGVWTLEEQAIAKRAGIWPVFGLSYRYWRLANFADTALNFNTIDMGEIEVYDGEIKHTGITCTTNFGWSSGQDSYLVDGIANTGVRAYNSGWGGNYVTGTITLDLGSPKLVTHIKIFSLYSQPRFPASFDLQSSADNSTYTTVATVTVGTSFTDLGGSVYSSAKVAVG
jgi:hypothetical protein